MPLFFPKCISDVPIRERNNFAYWTASKQYFSDMIETCQRKIHTTKRRPNSARIFGREKKENIFFTWVGPKILESPPVRYYVINPNIYEKVECRKKGLFIEAGGCTFKRGVPVFEWVKKWSHIWVGIKGEKGIKTKGGWFMIWN